VHQVSLSAKAVAQNVPSAPYPQSLTVSPADMAKGSIRRLKESDVGNEGLRHKPGAARHYSVTVKTLKDHRFFTFARFIPRL
jgi:hypothetical protein